MKQNNYSMRHRRYFAASCLLFFFLFSGLVQAKNNDLAAQTVTAKFNNVTLNEVIWELQKQTDFTFIYSTADIQKVKVNSVNVENAIITDILDRCMENSELTYTVHGGVIAIKKAEKVSTPTPAVQQAKEKITGMVVDDSGEPLLGVNIVIKGTTQGVVTDFDGNFSIDADRTAKNVLVFSYIGFSPIEIDPVFGSPMRVVMKSDELLLEEVIITGYGTYKKSAYAGSASTVKIQEKEDVPATDFKTLLQGSASGIQVNSTSGTVGGKSSITIRGLGSFNATTNPLYVIDGVPVMEDLDSGISGGTDIMATLNTSDIENITVMKDAAAASLYGSRAANGVILITTKSGKEGKPVFNFKSDWGFSDYATKFRETMSGPERREVLYEGLVNQGLYMRNMNASEADAYAAENIDKYAPIPWSGWTDWESALFRDKAAYQNYEFSASGGDKKTSLFSSIAYTDQDGLARQQNFSRITGRLNFKYSMTDKLQVGANILYSALRQDGSSEGGTYTAPIYSTRHKVSASDPIYNEDGTYNTELLANGKRNPQAALDYNYKRQKVDRSFNTIYANYTLLDGLVLNSTFSLDHTNSSYRSWNDPRSSDGESDNGSLSSDMYQYDQMVWKNSLTYTTVFDKHHLDFLGGYETHQYKRSYISGSVRDFPNVDKHAISNGSSITGLSGYQQGWRLLSYLGRVNYDFDHKYYLGGSVRTDASSRLHRDNRWGTFWSVSGAWRLSSEEFMQSVENILSDMKLRVSYGSNGTLPSSFYDYMDLVRFGQNYDEKPGIIEYQIGNKNLKWEKNYNLNLGLDVKLFDKVNATIEFYQRKTSDLLMDKPISNTTGFGTMIANVGRVQNRGVELELNSDILRRNAFSWNSQFNVGHNKNKIVNLGDQEEIVGSYTIRKVGESYYSFYVKEFAGINPETGYPQYYVNATEGDKTITEDATEANYIIYKNADPTISGGWTNTLRYKMIDLSFTLTFMLGGYSYDNAAQKLEHAGKETAHNLQTLYRDRWQKPGDKTNIEMVMVGNPYDMSTVVNSRRVHSTDHLRLKNLSIGFSVPKNIVRKASLENVRAYFSAVNLWTWAAYDGYDPEVPSNGVIYFDTPKLKTLTFGIDIKF